MNNVENITEQESSDVTKITVHEFAIIHAALAETYNLFKDSLQNEDFRKLSKEQLENAIANIYVVFSKVDKLLEPHRENLLNKQGE